MAVGGWAFALLCGGTLRAETATAEERAAARPNILLLVAEDMSPRVGAFGDPVARTPNLDRLAREGVRYTRVFTTAGVCAPSRAALILGRHQFSTGTQHMRAATRPEGGYLAVPPASAKAFPELLRRSGYFTFQHGKLDYQFSGTGSGSGPISIWDAEDNEGAWTDRSGDEPFFGMVNFMVTHESGLFPPLGHWPSSLTHLAMQVFQAWQRWGWTEGVEPTDPDRVGLPPYYPDLPEIRADLARHYDNIQIMDAQVGAWLARLEREGLADDTVVIWTTDHGDGLPRAKRELFDSGLHVPLIVRWPPRFRPPHVDPGDEDDRLVSFVDLTAALLTLGAAPRPSGLHGHDFLAPGAARRTFVFAGRDRIDDTDDHQRAVRSDRYKYIVSQRPELPGGHPSAFREHLASVQALQRADREGRLDTHARRWFEPPGEERLFDLEDDPHELHDRAQHPAYAEVRAMMREALAEFRRRVPDTSDRPEAELVARFQPDGSPRATAPPTLSLERDELTLASATEGASIEIRIDGGRSRPYVGPLSLPAGTHLAARAQRYGFTPSAEIEWVLP